MYGCKHPYIYTSTNGCFDGLSRTGYNHAKEPPHGQYPPAALKRPDRWRLSNLRRCRSHGPILWRLVLYPEWGRIGPPRPNEGRTVWHSGKGGARLRHKIAREAAPRICLKE